MPCPRTVFAGPERAENPWRRNPALSADWDALIAPATQEVSGMPAPGFSHTGTHRGDRQTALPSQDRNSSVFQHEGFVGRRQSSQFFIQQWPNRWHFCGTDYSMSPAYRVECLLIIKRKLRRHSACSPAFSFPQ